MSNEIAAPSTPASDQRGDASKPKPPGGFGGVPWYVLSRVGGAAISFATVMLFARLLGPSGYGLYSITIGAGLTLSTALFGWISYSFTRFYSASGDEAMDAGQVYGLLAAGVVMFALVVGVTAFFAPEQFVLVALLAGGYAVCWSLMELSATGLRVRRMARPYAMAVLGRAVLSSALGATFALMGGGGVGAVAGTVLGVLIVGLALIPSNLGGGARVSMPARKSLMKFISFGGPLALTAAGAMFAALALHGVILHHLDLEAAGYFAAADNISQRSIRMLMLAINLGVSVEIYRAYENGGLPAASVVLERHGALLGLVSLPILAIMAFTSDLVAQVAFGSEFAPSVAPLLVWHALAAVLGGFQASYLSFSFLLTKRTWPQLVIFFVMLGTSVALAWILVPRMGVMGASIAATAAWAVSSASYALFGAQAAPIPWPLRALFRMAIAIAPSAALMVLANNMPNEVMGLGVLALALLVLPVMLLVFDYPDVRHYVSKVKQRFTGRAQRAQQPTG